jgi:hypothetical protein
MTSVGDDRSAIAVEQAAIEVIDPHSGCGLSQIAKAKQSSDTKGVNTFHMQLLLLMA